MQYHVSTLDENEVPDALVEELAHELVNNPTNRTNIALRICGGDFGMCQRLLERANHVSFAQRVIELQKTIPKTSRLKSKEDFALEVQDAMGDMKGELLLKTWQFYAKLMGYTTDTVSTTTTVQNVIMIPQGTSDPTEWSAGAAKHAKELKAEASVIDEQ